MSNGPFCAEGGSGESGSSADVFVLRTAGTSDVSSIANLHLEAFPSFFLSFLGARFLREFYRGVALDESGVLVVAEFKGSICGFVAGSSEPAGFYTRLIRRRWVNFALAALPAVLRRPKIAARLLRALRLPAEQRPKGREALLMSIAADPQMRNKGVGRRLLTAFAQSCRQTGIQRIRLTTDAAANDSVNAFYTGFGFTRSAQYSTPEGRLMNEYRLDL